MKKIIHKTTKANRIHKQNVVRLLNQENTKPERNSFKKKKIFGFIMKELTLKTSPKGVFIVACTMKKVLLTKLPKERFASLFL